MFFKRKAYYELLDWKNKWANEYAIMLEGARRVGKSTIAETFAKENYKSYIKVDFANIKKDLLATFDDIADLDTFFLRLQTVTGVRLYRHESVIIFDEIQLLPKARQAIKYLVKDGRYHYIETGSLISIKKNVKDIVIPSEEMKISVYPMDYEEFCWANGNQSYELFPQILTSNKPIGDSTNRKLMRDFRVYMAVGGMPQAVEAYLDKRSFKEIDAIKRRIIGLYEEDFMKIDPTGRLSMIYNDIPAQLALKRNRFKVSSITGKRKSKKDEELIFDLIQSKTVLPCYNVKNPETALESTKNLSEFKLYCGDIGLFTTMIFNSKKITEDNIYSKLLSDKLNSNLGYLYENAIAQVIASCGYELLYHFWTEANETHAHEVDFLISDGAKIVPIEVKSSSINNHSSIDKFCEKYSSFISRRILFSQHDIGNCGMLELKPIYLVPSVLKSFKRDDF